jgi:hypothetical protein
MKKLSIAELCAGLAVAGLAPAFVALPRAFAQTEMPTSPPGDAVFCAWAIYCYAAEVSARCHPGENNEVQQELERSASRIDACFIANSRPPLTAADIDYFKRRQGKVGSPKEQLCQVDADDLYDVLVARGAPDILKGIDQLVARPGPPAWETCM